jgi:hypothetical protein
MPCYVFFVSHFIYQTTGNMLVTIWLAYILNMPNSVQIWSLTGVKGETNLD